MTSMLQIAEGIQNPKKTLKLIEVAEEELLRWTTEMNVIEFYFFKLFPIAIVQYLQKNTRWHPKKKRQKITYFNFIHF